MEGRLDCEHEHAARKYAKSKASQRIFLCVGITVHGQKADGVAFPNGRRPESQIHPNQQNKK
jgi:hypothetical protein